MSTPAQRIQGSKNVEDVERQVNIALERLQGQVNSAMDGIAAAPTSATVEQIQKDIAAIKAQLGL